MKLHLAALLFLPLVSSCKSEAPLRTDLFSESCAQLFSCGCFDAKYDDATQCEQTRATQFEGLVERADAAGLTIDEACLQREDIYLKLGCKTEEEAPKECSYCAVAHGTVAAGQACTHDGEASDCAQGLRCVDDVCLDPCALKLGAACLDPVDEVIGECEAGLYCDSDSRLCAQLAGPGEPCSDSRCAEGFNCSTDDLSKPLVCRPRAGEGQECFVDLDCVDGLSCNLDEGTGTSTCGPPPKLGERCSNQCAGEAFCSSGFCTASPVEGESCLGSPCATGFECTANDFCLMKDPLVCIL